MKLGLTLLVTYFLFRSLSVSWRELVVLDPLAWRPRFGLLALSLALLLASGLYVARLWAGIVASLGGPRLGFRTTLSIYFLASLGRYVPGKVWQLAGLAYLASRRGASAAVASFAAVLAQVFSLCAAIAIGALYFTEDQAAALARELAPWAIALALVSWIAASYPPLLRSLVKVALRERPPSGAARLALGPWFGLRWLLLHLPAWLGYGLAFASLWAALPALPRLSLPAAMGGFAIAYVLGYVALFAPAGLGVREGIMALLLAPWLGPSNAAVLAVASRVWLTFAELLPLLGLAAARGVAWAVVRASGEG